MGGSEGALECGPAVYERSQEPPIRNNCSGKHAGVLALCRHWGYDTSGYIEPNHPVQRKIFEPIEFFFDTAWDSVEFAVDGCGMPIFALPLRVITTAFARAADSQWSAPEWRNSINVVLAAMAKHPEYAGGTRANFDTELMRATRGDAIAKIGAEGMYAVALRSKGLGLAAKVIDGNSRVLPPIVISCLARLGALPEKAAKDLAPFARPIVYNAAGKAVGHIEISSEAWQGS